MNHTTSWKQLGAVALASSIITLGAYKLIGLDYKQVVFQEVASPKKDDNLATLTKKTDALKAGSPTTDFVAVAERVTPSVVHIVATFDGVRAGGRQTEQMPDIFKRFFGEDPDGSEFFRQNPRGGKSQGSGSGVIVSADGYIVTNNHVVGEASEVKVILNDQRTYTAEIVGTAPSVDLAVIKIKERNLPNLVFGNSDEVKVGEWVLAVGNPFNLESTVTAGIVSAKGRNLNILRDQVRNGANDAIESFIQTDAAVNPGNSGGALVNTNGELIGINTAIATPTGTFAGYSFAVPASIVKKVMRDLIEYGSLQRGYLGVQIRSLNGELANEKNLKEITEGAYVSGVEAKGAAEEAGIREGDVIVGVDGKKIRTSPELMEEMARRRPGDRVQVQVIRAGKAQTFTLYLKGKSGNTTPVAEPSLSELNRKLGAEFANAPADELSQLRLSGGVKVARIFGGKLHKAGVQQGFIITKVNGKAVKTATDFNKVLQEVGKGEDVMLRGKYPDGDEEFYYGFEME